MSKEAWWWRWAVAQRQLNCVLRFAFCIRRGDLRAAPIHGPNVDIAEEDGIANVDVLPDAEG